MVKNLWKIRGFSNDQRKWNQTQPPESPRTSEEETPLIFGIRLRASTRRSNSRLLLFSQPESTPSTSILETQRFSCLEERFLFLSFPRNSTRTFYRLPETTMLRSTDEHETFAPGLQISHRLMPTAWRSQLRGKCFLLSSHHEVDPWIEPKDLFRWLFPVSLKTKISRFFQVMFEAACLDFLFRSSSLHPFTLVNVFMGLRNNSSHFEQLCVLAQTSR